MKFLASLPALFSDSVVDYDGKGGYEARPLRGGETVTSALVIEDMTMPAGGSGGSGDSSASQPRVTMTLAARTIVVEDNVAPAYFDYLPGNLTQTREGGSGSDVIVSLRPSGSAAVIDDQAEGHIELVHVLTPESVSAEALQALVAAFAGENLPPGAIGRHTVPAGAFRPNVPLPLAGIPALAASRVALISPGGAPGTWGFDFEDLSSRERLGVVSNLLARDAKGNASRVQALVTVEDRTPPVVTTVSISGVSSSGARVTAAAADTGDANAGAQTALYAGVYETASAPATDTDASASLVFDPATGLFAGALQSKRLVAGTAAFDGAPALRDLTAHTVLVAAVDTSPARNVSKISREEFATLDGTPPVISSFGAAQSPTGYSFSLDAATTRVSDNRNGPLKLYFFLETAAIADTGAFVTTHAANEAVAKNEAFAYAAASNAVAPPALPAASKFWNGSAWADVAEATLSLNAHFVAIDAAGNASSATVAKTVADRSPPNISSFAVRQGGVPDYIAAETKHEFIADRPAALDPRITFARASVATRVNSAGLIETVSVNTPRFDYDPVTLALKGLLIEEARTNTLSDSTDLVNASWVKTGVAVVPSTNFPIFSNQSVFLMTANGTTGFKTTHHEYVASEVTRTFSVFLRRGSNNFAQIRPNSGGASNFANFDLSMGIAGTTGGGIIPTITPWKDGWYRCAITLSSSVANTFVVGIVSSASALRGESNTLSTSIYVAAPQIEDGSFATSYIPTGATTVTRAADVATISGANLTSWYNPLEGTFVVRFQTLYSGVNNLTRTVLSGDGSPNKRLIYLRVTDELVASFDGDSLVTATGDATGPFVKCALSYAASGGRSIALAGTEAVSGAIATGTSTLSIISIGSLNGLEVMCGWVKGLVYYPRRLPDADLPALSADDYSFSVPPAVTITDGRVGPLKTYLLLASGAVMNSAALNTFVAARKEDADFRTARNEAVAYTTPGTAVSSPYLFTDKFWNTTLATPAWSQITETAPALNAHLVVYDAAGVVASAAVTQTVADRTAPVISSFAVRQSGIPDSLAAETKYEFIADRPDTLDPRITFTRASVATRVNSAGLIETVPVNTPRFDHDPVTLERKGLLIEEARTNLILQSESIGVTGWAKYNLTVTANAAVSPSGSTSAYKIVPNTNNVDHIARQAVTLVATKTYTISCYVILHF